MNDPPPLINLKLSHSEGPLARSLVVVEIKTPRHIDSVSELDVTYVLVGASERTRDLVGEAVNPARTHGGFGTLPIGEHTYKFWFMHVEEAGLSKIKEKFGEEEVERSFMNFTERKAYLDLELVGLATLFTAGGLLSTRFLSVPMSRVRVARFAM